MEDDSDFTFCQVGTPVEQDGMEEKNLASDFSRITFKDGYSNGTSSGGSGGFLGKPMMLANNASLKREETIGSLSFSVTEASYTQSSELSRQAASSSALTSKNLQENKPSARKPAPRAKVPFEKGYSQMDWLKLTRTHPDLAGLKGQSNKTLISMTEVKQHQTEGSMWTVLRGCVYNLSPYMKFHPGGVDMLMKAVGKDCTSLFNKYHAWVNAEFLLEKCLVGTLDYSQ